MINFFLIFNKINFLIDSGNESISYFCQNENMFFKKIFNSFFNEKT